MVENSFEDTRNSIQEMIEIFNISKTNNQYRNKQFEEDVIQIIYKKSIKNFELFAYTFDFICDYQLKNFDEFIKQTKQLRNKEKQVPKVIELFYASDDSKDRDKTVKLAFRIYKQHLKMIDDYTNLYVYNDKISEELKDRIFDDEFYRKGYKFMGIVFDVFLSHKYYLRFYNIIIFYILTIHYNLIVYVDWIFDYNVDRKKLSEETVKLLKYRMKQSKKLIFFNILNSSTTNWMAWEVGYFSCLKENSIGILDLDGYCTGNKNVEVLSSNDIIKYDSIKGLFLEKANQSIIDWI